MDYRTSMLFLACFLLTVCGFLFWDIVFSKLEQYTDDDD